MKSKYVIVLGLLLSIVWIISNNSHRLKQKDEPLKIIALSPTYQKSSAIASNAGIFEILENQSFDKIAILDDTLQDSIDFMRHKLNAHPEMCEIDFIVRVLSVTRLKKESLLLENVSATTALKAIALKYNVSVYIDKQSIVFAD